MKINKEAVEIKVQFSKTLIIETVRWLGQTPTFITVDYDPHVKDWTIRNEEGKYLDFNRSDFSTLNMVQAIATHFDLSFEEGSELFAEIKLMDNFKIITK